MSSPTFFATSPDAGRRLDLFLVEKLPDHSRAAIKRWIEAGRVWIEGVGATPKPDHRMRAGERVTVDVPPPREVVLKPEPLPGLGVIFEDRDLLVVDKPPGLVVHPSPGHSSGTLVNALLYRGGDLSTAGGEDRPGLVHRLDRDTSGVLVVARTDLAHQSLTGQFRARAMKKEYRAIVEGAPERDRGVVDAPIGRSSRDRKKMVIRGDGRPARTRVEVLERFPGFSHLACFPETGRTHQIRVHLARLGTPVLCDAQYGRRARAYECELLGRGRRAAGEEAVMARQALHALRLGFAHPRSGEWVSFESPLPADIEATLAVLRQARRFRAG